MDGACISQQINCSPLDILSSTSFDRKKEKLIKLAKSVLNHPKHKDEFQSLMALLGVNESEIMRDYIHYNLNIRAFSNEIYELLSMRFVLHIHNLLQRSGHQERQVVISEFVAMTGANTVADVGFDVPTLFVKEALQTRRLNITLCDDERSSFIFAQALLGLWDLRWRDVISFKQTDVDASHFIGDFDTYIFKDSLQHFSDPTYYLYNCVKQSPAHAQFVLSVPIGPIISSHYMAWSTKKEAIAWLDLCGLEIKVQREVHVNPAVDLFAEPFGYKFYDLIALCDKKL